MYKHLLINYAIWYQLWHQLGCLIWVASPLSCFQEQNSQWHMGLQFLGDIHASGVDLDIMNYVAGISACSWAKQAKHNELMLTFNCARLLNVEFLELSRFWMVLGLFPLGKQNSTYRCSGLVLAKSFALLGGASCGEVGRDIHTSRTTPNDRLLV